LPSPARSARPTHRGGETARFESQHASPISERTAPRRDHQATAVAQACSITFSERWRRVGGVVTSARPRSGLGPAEETPQPAVQGRGTSPRNNACVEAARPRWETTCRSARSDRPSFAGDQDCVNVAHHSDVDRPASVSGCGLSGSRRVIVWQHWLRHGKKRTCLSPPNSLIRQTRIKRPYQGPAKPGRQSDDNRKRLARQAPARVTGRWLAGSQLPGLLRVSSVARHHLRHQPVRQPRISFVSSATCTGRRTPPPRLHARPIRRAARRGVHQPPGIVLGSISAARRRTNPGRIVVKKKNQKKKNRTPRVQGTPGRPDTCSPPPARASTPTPPATPAPAACADRHQVAGRGGHVGQARRTRVHTPRVFTRKILLDVGTSPGRGRSGRRRGVGRTTRYGAELVAEGGEGGVEVGGRVPTSDGENAAVPPAARTRPARWEGLRGGRTRPTLHQSAESARPATTRSRSTPGDEHPDGQSPCHGDSVSRTTSLRR